VTEPSRSAEFCASNFTDDDYATLLKRKEDIVIGDTSKVAAFNGD